MAITGVHVNDEYAPLRGGAVLFDVVDGNEVDFFCPLIGVEVNKKRKNGKYSDDWIVGICLNYLITVEHPKPHAQKPLDVFVISRGGEEETPNGMNIRLSWLTFPPDYAAERTTSYRS